METASRWGSSLLQAASAGSWRPSCSATWNRRGTGSSPCGSAGGCRGIGVLGLGLVPNLWLAGGVAFVTYGLDAYGSVLYDPLIQEGVPAELLGRVASVNYVLGFALSPLGLVAAGTLAEAIGVRTTLLIGGGMTALTTMIPFLPGVKDPTLS